MIARLWRGTTARRDADAYARYVAETGIRTHKATAGNRGSWLLRRDDGERTEFVVLSLWDWEESIRAFAGTPIERARFFPEDERFLVDRGEQVLHYTVSE